MFTNLSSSQDTVPELARLGRHLDTVFMLSTEDEDWMITIKGGRVERVRGGPFVMPSYAFRMVAARSDWADFLQPVPGPGCHDLFALLRRGVLRFEGNLHPLMSHLLYFKLLLASLRSEGEAA